VRAWGQAAVGCAWTGSFIGQRHAESAAMSDALLFGPCKLPEEPVLKLQQCTTAAWKPKNATAVLYAYPNDNEDSKDSY
jgi:hypothetical protein